MARGKLTTMKISVFIGETGVARGNLCAEAG